MNIPLRAIIAGIAICIIAFGHSVAHAADTDDSIAVYFSPRGGAQQAIVNEINAAQQEILVLAYSFTSKPISEALMKAKKRGLAIYAVLDKSQLSEKYSSADFLAHSGIYTFIDSDHQIAHNKVMIIDRQTLITGSYNFTRSAEENNSENLLVIKNHPALVEAYLNNFVLHKDHARQYNGR